MRKARRLDTIVEIFQSNRVPDGFSGYTVEYKLITKSWASIKTASTNSRSAQRVANLGFIDSSQVIILELRKRPDIDYNAINQFINYRGSYYVIQSVNEIDFNNNIIEIIAVRQVTDIVAELATITNNTFDNTFDNTFR